jgi:prefoldin beta subunit
MASPDNPGGAMAAEIDRETANFRLIQEQMQKIRGDLQIVLGQLTENEMVQQELDLMDSSSTVYKMVGPVLIKNSFDDAKDTVSKRVEFITTEKKRLEAKGMELETKGNQIAGKVQQMQQMLQQATAAAVQEIQQQHAS